MRLELKGNERKALSALVEYYLERKNAPSFQSSGFDYDQINSLKDVLKKLTPKRKIVDEKELLDKLCYHLPISHEEALLIFKIRKSFDDVVESVERIRNENESIQDQEDRIRDEMQDLRIVIR